MKDTPRHRSNQKRNDLTELESKKPTKTLLSPLVRSRKQREKLFGQKLTGVKNLQLSFKKLWENSNALVRKTKVILKNANC